MSANVLVIGATGMTGRGVAQELVKAEIPVRALVRDRQKAQRLLPSSIDLQVGDVFSEADVERALQGITHVYFHPAVSIHRSTEKSMDQVGTRLLIKHLPKAAHLIKLSEIGASPNPQFYDIDCKYRSEQDIQGRVANWTILRPTWFMESIPELLTMGSASVCFGTQPNPIWWLSSYDYARTVVACVQKPAVSRNRIFTVQGVESHRMLDALRLFNREAQTGKWSVRLPLGLLSLPAQFSAEYRFNQQIMRYYDRRHEQFESDDTHQLLHKPTMTLGQFARHFRQNA